MGTKREPQVRSSAWLERVRGHQFQPGDLTSRGECEECGRVVGGRRGYYQRTSYEYDEWRCLCRKCLTEKMTSDEEMWEDYGKMADEEAAAERAAGTRSND